MTNGNRDLLVLAKNEALSEKDFESEIQQLHQILFEVEVLANICLAYEILDVNKRKPITKQGSVQKIILEKNHKPFVFLFNKN